MIEQLAEALYVNFPLLVFVAVVLLFAAALINRRRTRGRELMDFEAYKEDWQRSHMYQGQIDKEAHSGFNRWLKLNFVLGKGLATVGFTPNIASALAFILSTGSAYYFIVAAQSISTDLLWSDVYFALAVALLLLSGLMDVLDGAVARLAHLSSPFGDLIDNVVDKYSDAIVLIAVIYGGLVNPFVGIIALLGSLLVDYARARTMGLGMKSTKVTIGERPFRMIIISSTVAFQFTAQLSAALGIQISIGEGAYLHEPFLSSIQWGILILAVLTHLSTLQIVHHAKKNLASSTA